MPVCALCLSPATNKCARCRCVSYCSPAHQKADWKAHKVDCPRLAQEALAAVFHPCDEELLLRITTCLAQNGYDKEVGVLVQLSKAFWGDEQIWDAFKDVPGPGGRTRLMHASKRGLLNRVRWLLARGARVNAATTLAMAPGSVDPLAIVGGEARGGGTGQLLPVSFFRSTPSRAFSRTDAGATALILASEWGHVEVVKELCDRAGVNLEAATAFDGYTALMGASIKGHMAVVRELCDRGANVHAARANGSTAAQLASVAGFVEVFCYLLNRGAKFDGFG